MPNDKPTDPSRPEAVPRPENSEATLYRCAELKIRMKQDKEEYDMLSLVAIERVKELSKGQETYQLELKNPPYGMFSVFKYRKYKYSSSVQNLEMNLKEQKKGEEADGTAEVEERDILKFNVKKDGLQTKNK